MCNLLLTQSAPFGIDSTWWTAFGVLIALAVAAGTPLIRGFIRWWLRLHLSIDAAREKNYTRPLQNRIWIRLPIRNASKFFTATNVEVFLEKVHLSFQDKATEVACVPLRFRWCHTEKPACDRIPSGSFRLLHLASYPMNHNPADPITLDLGGEVGGSLPSVTSFQIPTNARLKLTLSLSADGIAAKTQTVSVNPISWLDTETPRVERSDSPQRDSPKS